jgi:hypothetical protein
MIDRSQLAAGIIRVYALPLRRSLGEIAQQADDLLSTQIACVCSRLHREGVICLARSLLFQRRIHRLRMTKTTNRITTIVPTKP